MRTHIIIFIFLLVSAESREQTIYLKFGPSFSKISTEATPGASQVTSEKGLIGFNAIAGVSYLNFKYFNLSSGMGFIQGGGEEELVTYTSPYQVMKYTARLNFLTVNTTFNLKIPVYDFMEPYICAGPRLDYLFSYSNG